MTRVGLAAVGLVDMPLLIAYVGASALISLGNNALCNYKEKKALGFDAKNKPRQPADALPSAPQNQPGA